MPAETGRSLTPPTLFGAIKKKVEEGTLPFAIDETDMATEFFVLDASWGGKMASVKRYKKDIQMRKMIMLALASFLWKQIQKRIGRAGPSQRF